MPPEPSTTQLLLDARSGDRGALDQLFPRVYDELRQIARARLRHHRPGETLNTTALVHETYLKLTAGETLSFADRSHFFALAARAMRFVIIGYARERTAKKRGGGRADFTFEDGLGMGSDADAEALDLITLNDALERLATVSERLAEVVELRFFGGMQHDEIAEATGRSVPTVKRDWHRARVWLYRAMHPTDDPPGAETTSEQ